MNLRNACLSLVILPGVAACGFAADPIKPATANGLVSLIDDVMVPAYRAGVVTSLAVKEGDHVTKDQVLAQIDRKQADLEVAAAAAEVEASEAKSTSNVEERYAVATHLVAVAEWQMGKEANDAVPNAVSKAELKRMELAADQAKLKIEASLHQKGVLGLESKTVVARQRLAELNVTQREVKAPLDKDKEGKDKEGIVAEVFVHAGEWIEPGKPLMRIVGLENLRVEAFISVADRLPSELLGRPAEARVILARDKVESFTGSVTFVSPIVQPGGDYRVWIEVKNKRDDAGQWLLRPGLEAEVVVSQ